MSSGPRPGARAAYHRAARQPAGPRGTPDILRARWTAVPDRWRWLVVPIAIAVASRAFSLAVILVHDLRAGHVPGVAFSVSDAGWYLGIAADGYHAEALRISASGAPQHDFAFFPLWPAILALGAPLPGSTAVTGAVVANLLFLLAAVLVWRLFADRFGERSASVGLALLAFSPAAYVFSLPYTESLFVLLAAASFLLPGSRWRGVVGAAAAVTRIAGLALALSALVEARFARGAARRAAVLAVVGAGLAFLGWVVFIALLTGDPLGYLRANPGWIRNGGLPQLLIALDRPTVQRIAWLVAYLTVVAGALLLVRRDRELAVYALAALALPLLPGGALGSMPRYALVAFPAFAMLAERLGRRGGPALVAVSAVAQVVFADWVFTGRFHP